MQMRLVTIGVGNLVSGRLAADIQGLGLSWGRFEV